MAFPVAGTNVGPFLSTAPIVVHYWQLPFAAAAACRPGSWLKRKATEDTPSMFSLFVKTLQEQRI